MSRMLFYSSVWFFYFPLCTTNVVSGLAFMVSEPLVMWFPFRLCSPQATLTRKPPVRKPSEAYELLGQDVWRLEQCVIAHWAPGGPGVGSASAPSILADYYSCGDKPLSDLSPVKQ